MFKRVIWFSTGAAAGASGMLWAQRKVKAQLDKATPAHLVEVARDSATGATRRVKGYVSEVVGEGRTAARDREAVLRDRYRVPPQRS